MAPIHNLDQTCGVMDGGDLVIIFFAGFAASLVDGALGMGFGPTSSSILLGSGLSPSATSTAVNLAKVFTGITAALAHWRMNNIDHRLVRRLALSGSVGAVIGVTVLANVDGDSLRPYLSGLLIVMAARILWRFSKPLPTKVIDPESPSGEDPVHVDHRGEVVTGFAGGVTNGLIGAWGPVVTPFLMAKGLAPRYAIGSVNTAEVAVAVVASGSLLASVGGAGLDVPAVAAMLAGGMLAAPLAAWLIRFLPARGLGVAVGTLLFILNVRELSTSAEVPALRWPAYAVAIAACVYAALRPRLLQRQLSPN